MVSSLVKYGREDEAAEYYLYCAVYLEFVHGIPPEQTLMMTIDEISELLNLPPKPLKYEGWNFAYGPAAFKNVREKPYNA